MKWDKIIPIFIVLLIFVVVLYYNANKQQEPAMLSGYFLDVFNVSNGEVSEIPANLTEPEIIAEGYEIIHINDTVLERYPPLENTLASSEKMIPITDEEASLIIKDFRGKIVEFNKNYYIIAIVMS